MIHYSDVNVPYSHMYSYICMYVATWLHIVDRFYSYMYLAMYIICGYTYMWCLLVSNSYITS